MKYVDRFRNPQFISFSVFPSYMKNLSQKQDKMVMQMAFYCYTARNWEDKPIVFIS